MDDRHFDHITKFRIKSHKITAIEYTIKGWFQQTERCGTGEVWWAGVTQDSPVYQSVLGSIG
jgi:hypothetical protein